MACDDPLPLSHDSSLATLALSYGSLAPAFSADVTSYTVTLPYPTQKLTMVAVASAAKARVVEQGGPNLAVGWNKFAIVVTAEDGSSTTYSVNVLRLSISTTDSSLASLSPSSGFLVPAFSPAVTSYTLSVDNLVQSLSFIAQTTNPQATLDQTGGSSLIVGQNIITFKVSSVDGSSSTVYTVKATRGASAVSSLASLQPSAGTLSPTFSPLVTAYQINLPYSTTQLTIAATATDPLAAVAAAGGPALAVGNNNFTFLVTAANGSSTTYVVHAVRSLVPSTVSSLSGLTLKYTYTTVSDGDTVTVTSAAQSLSPAFSPTSLSYSAIVPNTATGLVVTPSPMDGTRATYVVSGTAAPKVGTNTVTIKVTAEDGVSTTSYQITVQRLPYGFPVPSNDSSLKSLAASAVVDGIANPLNLSPAFSPATTDYGATVQSAASTTTLSLSPVPNSAKAVFSVLVGVAESPAQDPITLTLGYNRISVKIIAEDGSFTVYHLLITMLSTAPKSNDSSLKALSLKEGSSSVSLNPSFSPATTFYTATLPAATSSVTVTATPNSSTASLGAIAGASGLLTGDNTISIPVSAADGSSTTYTVAAFVSVPVSTDSSLISLSIAGASLVPAFSPGVTSYTATLPAHSASATVTAITTYYQATAQVKGNTALVQGSNAVSVIVKAADGTTTRTYKITVTVPSSSDSSLASLALSVGGVAQTLSPAFSPSITAYNLSLPAGTSAVTVAATPNDPAALGVQGAGTRSLSPGANVISLVVSAADGSQTSYSIVVTVASASSTDSKLAGLSISPGTLAPAFAASVTSYSASVPSGTTSVAVTALPNDSSASVSVSGASSLVTGPNTVTVLVTAPDGVTKTTYTIVVTLSAAGSGIPAGAALSGTATYGGSSHAAVWIWITDSSGSYVDTILYYPYSQSEIIKPNAYTSSKTTSTTDGVSSATWNPSTTRTFSWDFKDSSGAPVPGGSYTFHIMVFQQSGGAQKLSTATLELGASAASQSFSTVAGAITAGSVSYTP